ncbi:FmdB family zinc ribbon protein [Solicola gregarius]|uniref:FmdB family transcriptional regulator n=1 Tax=Solicola gregarius TaxID=2908642 RepID=A0AA46YML8_9ACTN|nr:FmdB family zinc ribbon protein [Solicola gregarius]UYM06641.1 FmdB family transcriptional regulator [Solicola gregarius]
MPTYQYLCTECGEPLEAQQSFSDPSLTDCPACGGRLRKVFNAVGVVFKGSGFYRNDSRAADKSETSSGSEKKSDTSSSTGSGNGSSTESSGGSKSDSKPASTNGSDTKAKTTASA